MVINHGKKTIGKQEKPKEVRENNHSSIPVSNFSVGDRVDREILQVLGLLHNGRHLLQRTLSSKESLREHYHDEK